MSEAYLGGADTWRRVRRMTWVQSSLRGFWHMPEKSPATNAPECARRLRPHGQLAVVDVQLGMATGARGGEHRGIEAL